MDNSEFTPWERAHPRTVMCGTIINFVVMFGAVITVFYAISLFTVERGIMGCIGGFLGAAMVFRLGPAPLFAAASTVIAFTFHKTGLWLPISSYILAVLSLSFVLLSKHRYT